MRLQVIVSSTWQLYKQCRQPFEHEEVCLPLCLLASGAVMASRAQSAGR